MNAQTNNASHTPGLLIEAQRLVESYEAGDNCLRMKERVDALRAAIAAATGGSL